MSSHHFIVARADSRWKVSYHGTEEGPFATKQMAVDAAIAAAKLAMAEGREVEVLVQDIESNFHSAWKSGVDDAAKERLSDAF